MPSHNHTGTMHAETAQGDSNDPQGRLLAISSVDDKIFSSASPAPNRQMHTDALIVNSAGGGRAFDIESPYLGVNFIIALQGVYPPRS